MKSAPTAAGVRITWTDLPTAVRDAVEATLGAHVVGARSQIGGFSPGTADRVVLSDERRVFVKSVSADLNDRSVQMHRDEARFLAVLPAHAPAPRLLALLEVGGWTTLLIEDVDGRQPALPWTPGDLALVADALAELHAAGPVAPPEVDRTYVETHAEIFTAWRTVSERRPDDLDPWCAQRLDALVEREQVAVEHLVGEALLHCDVRPDNMLVRAGGDVVLVDWAWACRGPWWVDPVQLLMSVVIQGAEGPDPAGELLAATTLTDAPRAHVESSLVTMLGMFEMRCRETPPPGLPTLRPWQRHCADSLRSWLAEHLDTL